MVPHGLLELERGQPMRPPGERGQRGPQLREGLGLERREARIDELGHQPLYLGSKDSLIVGLGALDIVQVPIECLSLMRQIGQVHLQSLTLEFSTALERAEEPCRLPGG